jgi:hypothetical protein
LSGLGFCGVVIAIHPTITIMARCPRLVRSWGVNLRGTYFKKLLMLNVWGKSENEVVVRRKAQCEMGTKHDT